MLHTVYYQCRHDRWWKDSPEVGDSSGYLLFRCAEQKKRNHSSGKRRDCRDQYDQKRITNVHASSPINDLPASRIVTATIRAGCRKFSGPYSSNEPIAHAAPITAGTWRLVESHCSMNITVKSAVMAKSIPVISKEM